MRSGSQAPGSIVPFSVFSSAPRPSPAFQAVRAEIDLILLEQTVVEAAKTFVLGKLANREFKRRAQANATLQDEYALFLGKNTYAFKKDSNLTIHASRMPGTNFIAAEGPRDLSDMEKFFENTLFNTKYPVSEIVAFAESLAYKSTDEQDFHEYFVLQRQYMAGRFQVDVNSLFGKVRATPSFHRVFPEGTFSSRLEIRDTVGTPKNLTVTLFNVTDGGVLDLTVDNTKEIVWQLYQKSLTQLVLVHCTSGIGRTGHFILMLLILNNYEKIFANENPVDAALQIHEILKVMRDVRPGLVLTEEQFKHAIRNAHELYCYGLRKRHEVEVKEAKDEVVTKAQVTA